MQVEIWHPNKANFSKILELDNNTGKAPIVEIPVSQCCAVLMIKCGKDWFEK